VAQRKSLFANKMAIKMDIMNNCNTIQNVLSVPNMTKYLMAVLLSQAGKKTTITTTLTMIKTTTTIYNKKNEVT
jgi:hypothetical protein